MTDKEIWKEALYADKPIKGFQVSNKGRVRTKRGVTKPWLRGSAEKLYLAFRDKDSKNIYVHRCVLFTFIGKPNIAEEADHIDGNKLNNALNNLEWVSRSENNIRAYKTGLSSQTHKRTLNNKEVAEIKELLPILSDYKISRKYNTHHNIIHAIRTGKSYKDY